MNVPDELSHFLSKLKRDFPTMLGSQLVGIYLWGSLTYQAFDARHSDVDCIVVTEHDLTDREFSDFEQWFQRAWESDPWVRKLDLRFVIQHKLLDKKSRCCQYHFGEFIRSGSDGNPFICINLKESGITLWGVDAKCVAPDVSRAVLRDALFLEIAYLKEDLAANAGNPSDLAFQHQAYAVLTACRIGYTVRHGTLVSKQQAFDWALRALPAAWHPLMIAAEKNRRQLTGVKTAGDESAALAFVRFIEDDAREAFSRE